MAFFNFMKAKPQRSVSDEPISPIFFIGDSPIRLVSNRASYSAASALKNPAVFRVISRIAQSVQSVTWFAEPDPTVRASEQASPTIIKALNSLLQSPNDTYTADRFRYWLAVNYALFSRAPFKVAVGATGLPIGMYPLDVKYLRGILNDRGSIEKYVYGSTKEKEVTFLTRRNSERLNNGSGYAYEIFAPTVSGSYENCQQSTAIETIEGPVRLINLLLQRALDTAGGHPNVKYVITSDRVITTEQKAALEKHLDDSKAGYESSGSVLLLSNSTIKIDQLDNDLKDIHSKLPMDDMTRQIAGVFGVPIALVGLGSADAAKYANNYSESRLSFWQDTIQPGYLIPIATGLTAALCPYGARISFDMDSIPAMWQGRALLGAELEKSNFLLWDEKRDVLGFPPLTEDQRNQLLQEASAGRVSPTATGTAADGQTAPKKR